MADGSAKPLADVRVGDAIYGTVREGFYLRYTITEVLAHWSTVKPAYRVTLEDGTKLVASGDHRFLTERGWKHVTGAEQGPDQRPFLTTNNKLMGFGGLRRTAEGLCGLPARLPVRHGPGRRPHFEAASYESRLGVPYEQHQFRLALTDTEALDRTRDYLRRVGIGVTEFDFSPATDTRKAMTAIRMLVTRHRACDRVAHSLAVRSGARLAQGLPGWHLRRRGQLQPGCLAGAEHGPGDPRLDRRERSDVPWLRATSWNRTDRPNGLTVIRLRGGLKEAMRFFHATDPAISRKRSIDGVASRAMPSCGSRRSSRSASRCRCTTSRPGRATSSPTAW